jgi:ABC-type lipoprotein export system ATPase subunit
MNKILKAENIKKTYISGKNLLNVLTGVSLEVEEGDIITIQGASGSGKSTLLHILGGIDQEYNGKLFIRDIMLNNLNERKIARIRNKFFGFVFQFYNLLPEFTAKENIAIPLIIGGMKKKLALEKAEEMLVNVEMSERSGHTPSQLSGGEQQRVGIARALINNPDIIFCDEPTGNLDEITGRHIQNLLFSLNKTMIIVTHDESIAKEANKRYYLKEGVLKINNK